MRRRQQCNHDAMGAKNMNGNKEKQGNAKTIFWGLKGAFFLKIVICDVTCYNEDVCCEIFILPALLIQFEK